MANDTPLSTLSVHSISVLIPNEIENAFLSAFRKQMKWTDEGTPVPTDNGLLVRFPVYSQDSCNLSIGGVHPLFHLILAWLVGIDDRAKLFVDADRKHGQKLPVTILYHESFNDLVNKISKKVAA